jgi:hypothetical protein
VLDALRILVTQRQRKTATVLGSAALQLGSITSMNLADTAQPARSRT